MIVRNLEREVKDRLWSAAYSGWLHVNVIGSPSTQALRPMANVRGLVMLQSLNDMT